MSEKNKEVETDMDEKAASLSIKLKADSGYTSEDTGRVSANQWAIISNIVHADIKDVYELLAFKLHLSKVDGEPDVYKNEEGQRFIKTGLGFQPI